MSHPKFYSKSEKNKDIIKVGKWIFNEACKYSRGSETKEQFDKLLKVGCDFFQGFYFSKPVPNIYDVLKSNDGNFFK